MEIQEESADCVCPAAPSTLCEARRRRRVPVAGARDCTMSRLRAACPEASACTGIHVCC
jgi:hypothetical protein